MKTKILMRKMMLSDFKKDEKGNYVIDFESDKGLKVISHSITFEDRTQSGHTNNPYVWVSIISE